MNRDFNVVTVISDSAWEAVQLVHDKGIINLDYTQEEVIKYSEHDGFIEFLNAQEDEDVVVRVITIPTKLGIDQKALDHNLENLIFFEVEEDLELKRITLMKGPEGGESFGMVYETLKGVAIDNECTMDVPEEDLDSVPEEVTVEETAATQPDIYMVSEMASLSRENFDTIYGSNEDITFTYDEYIKVISKKARVLVEGNKRYIDILTETLKKAYNDMVKSTEDYLIEVNSLRLATFIAETYEKESILVSEMDSTEILATSLMSMKLSYSKPDILLMDENEYKEYLVEDDSVSYEVYHTALMNLRKLDDYFYIPQNPNELEAYKLILLGKNLIREKIGKENMELFMEILNSVYDGEYDIPEESPEEEEVKAS